MESSKISINDLPNGVIVNILSFLENSDVQKAILTCKSWKRIIESSYLWPLKLNCGALHYEKSPLYHFLATTERKFGSVELRGSLLICGPSSVIDFFHRHGSNIIKLSLVSVLLHKLVTLAKFLRLLPNLRELTVSRLDEFFFDSSDISENELPVLPKLETLQIFKSQYWILKCLRGAKVKTFKVMDSSLCNSYYCDCDTLNDFLKTQDRITTLALRFANDSHRVLFRTRNTNDPMPFQLTRLSLFYELLVGYDPSDLVNFIEKHSQSLKELELEHHFHWSIYECVFAKMTNLETLNLVMDDIPTYSQMLGRLTKNQSIKNLIIKEAPLDSIESRRFFRDFLKYLPNVTSLTVLGLRCPKAIMEAAAENFTQLKWLHVQRRVTVWTKWALRKKNNNFSIVGDKGSLSLV